MKTGDKALSLRGVSKCYEVYAKPHHRLIQSLMRGRRQYYREFWALRDICFDVNRGQTVGVVGANGSGKSTLLQIVCGTLAQTSGDVQIAGRVTGILELGSGFNTDFTGRENIYVGGAVLGLSQSQIDSRFDDIASFADIGNFIDQPIKTYSSGMLMRLAFAVVANVDADILVVDEALAVGDARFQLKCFRRIEELQSSGHTILFVSHDSGLVKRLCSEAILLDKGELVARGLPKHVLNVYSRLQTDPSFRDVIQSASRDRGQLAGRSAEEGQTLVRSKPNHLHPPTEHDERRGLKLAEDEQAHLRVDSAEYSYGGERGEILDIKITDEAGAARGAFVCGEQITVTFRAIAREGIDESVFGLTFKNRIGAEVYGTNTLLEGMHVDAVSAGDEFSVSFVGTLNVQAGDYFLSVGWVDFDGDDIRVIHRRYETMHFQVLPADRSYGYANFFGSMLVRRPLQGPL